MDKPTVLRLYDVHIILENIASESNRRRDAVAIVAAPMRYAEVTLTLFTAHAGSAHLLNSVGSFFLCILWLNDTSYTLTAKASEEVRLL